MKSTTAKDLHAAYAAASDLGKPSDSPELEGLKAFCANVPESFGEPIAIPNKLAEFIGNVMANKPAETTPINVPASAPKDKK
jgi:hypothetical protein